MPIAKSIPGIQRGPDFDREVHDVARVERTIREAKYHRNLEPNDPIVVAALEAVGEVAEVYVEQSEDGRNMMDSIKRETEAFLGNKTESVEKDYKTQEKEHESAREAAFEESKNSIKRKIDVQYDRESGLVVMSVYSGDGEKLIRRVPPEEAIRMAHNLKHARSQYLDSTF